MNETMENIDDVILSMDDMELVLHSAGSKIAIDRDVVILRVPDEEINITESPSIGNVIGLIDSSMGFPLFNGSGYMYDECELRDRLQEMGLSNV